MKQLLIALLALGLVSSLASAQTSSITIPAGARIYVPAGATICPDVLNIYGTLECANASGICPACKVVCQPGSNVTPSSLCGAEALIAGPDSIDFGDVLVGQSLNRSVTITNTGTKELNISTTTTAPAPFTIFFNGGPQTLQPGASVIILLAFTPAAAGAITGTFSIQSDASNAATFTVDLYGNGLTGPPAIDVKPLALDFGTVAVGSDNDLPVTIKNTGGSPLILSNQTVNGTGFSLQTSATTPIAPGDSAIAIIRFSPQVDLTASGTYVITSNDPAMGTVTVSLSGKSVSLQPIISVTPDPVQFGQVTVGSPTDKTVTVTNTGDADLVLTSQTVSSGMFSLVTPSNTTIIPGGSSTASVRFQPSSAGSHMGTYTIVSNDPANPTVAVQLLGAGTAQQTCLAVSPLTVDFGETPPTTPVTRDVRITNSCATPMTVNLSISGSGFALTGPTALPIAGNDNTVIQVRFIPTNEGQYSGTLTVSTASPTQSIDVPLTGTCRATTSGPRLSVDNTTINFGKIVKGTPKELPLQVSNTGDQDLVFNKQFITSGDSLIFSIVTMATTPLAPGSSSTMRLRAYSQVEGVYMSKLRLETNDNSIPRFDVSLIANVVTDVETIPGIPTGITLHQNYPNPFNPSTEIDYEIDRSATVRLDVFSPYGQRVATLVDDRQNPGIYKATFNAAGLPSGVYAAVLRVTNTETQHVRTIMMTLMK